MYLNAFRIRLALMAAGVLVMGIYLIAGGSRNIDRKTSIILHFGVESEEFVGCEVLIDEISVGRLQRVGNLCQNGFRVPAGDHVVELVHPDYRCLPTRVTTVRGASSPHLRLDFTSDYSASGVSETVIVFEGGRSVL